MTSLYPGGRHYLFPPELEVNVPFTTRKVSISFFQVCWLFKYPWNRIPEHKAEMQEILGELFPVFILNQFFTKYRSQYFSIIWRYFSFSYISNYSLYYIFSAHNGIFMLQFPSHISVSLCSETAFSTPIVFPQLFLHTCTPVILLITEFL